MIEIIALLLIAIAVPCLAILAFCGLVYGTIHLAVWFSYAMDWFRGR
jgi:hypothetical protein